MLKEIIIKLIVKPFFDAFYTDFSARVRLLRLDLHNFKSKPPILIYSMGKAGTSTVAASLRYLNIPFHKAHNLSYDGIRGSEQRSLSFKNRKVPPITRAGKIIRRKIDNNGGPQGINWKIITLTREPIAHAISNLFQSIENRNPELIEGNGELKNQTVIDKLQSQLEKGDEPSIKWFDRELKEVFDINVYDYPYNHEDGYLIICVGTVEVLLIRAEDLDRSFQEAIGKFLNLDASIELKLANIGSDKKFAVSYKHVKKNIILSANACEKIYQSEYARHFYTENEREKLIKRWSGGDYSA